MPPRHFTAATLLVLAAASAARTARADFAFSTGGPDGKIATATRPDTGGKIEIESADDFILNSQTHVTSATFTGLLTGGATTANIGQVVVEIYGVFPVASDVGRTTGPPDFSTPQVPTRVNSPSDVALDSRDSTSGSLSFTTASLSDNFTALNSVLNGINPKPKQTTTGEGPVNGEEVEFSVTFATPFDLAAGHYFFVPQVEVTGGEFMWLSAPKPIVAPGTPFNPDLQSWIRNENLDPDWLRIGTDIVGAGAFNASFSLAGQTVPEPSSLALCGLGTLGLGAYIRRRSGLVRRR